MQTALTVAAGLSILTGLVHSVLGEWLIFRHLRQGTLVPQLGAPPLRARNVRILWATWHLASVFGWAFAAVLLGLASSPAAPVRQLVFQAIAAANLGGAILVLVGTRGRHPGWIALGAVAVLVWVASGGA
ncbi:hypothetical protein [Thermomonas fusca]